MPANEAQNKTSELYTNIPQPSLTETRACNASSTAVLVAAGWFSYPLDPANRSQTSPVPI